MVVAARRLCRGTTQHPIPAVPLPRLVARCASAEEDGELPGAVVCHFVYVSVWHTSGICLGPKAAVPFPGVGAIEIHAHAAARVIHHRIVSGRGSERGHPFSPRATGLGDHLDSNSCQCRQRQDTSPAPAPITRILATHYSGSAIRKADSLRPETGFS